MSQDISFHRQSSYNPPQSSKTRTRADTAASNRL